jgi:hypothetical protein
MDRPLYGKRVREMSNSMCNMRALHRRLERAGPRRLTFPFARFRRTDWELPSELCDPLWALPLAHHRTHGRTRHSLVVNLED